MTSPPSSGAPWARVRELFDAALPLPAADREALFTDPALDAALVAELRSLLAHAGQVAQADAAGAAFLDQPAAPLLADAMSQAASDAGLTLGPWRLVSPLGAGGMGEVWRAERADGRYEGAAAVKLLKRGMDSAAVLARFALEQQSLARLNHPHIARLLDAGLSADGRPYFVMELVDGQPIDRACEGLPVEARLQLFLQLADAVAHAHRNLLVHRALKPGNVLVDGQGQVKLLDFGIAKALDPLDHPLEGADPGHTAAGERPFTPHYASPEQVRGEPVSTATDLYSLGVLLYVMLTGQRPYGRAATSALDAARAVLEEEPTRPSSVATPAPGWEATRRRLQGDLDNILLKALEKPLERRYASVDALAADIRAFLGGYPVGARPAGAAYLLRKFIARNRWAVAAGSLGGIGLATGLTAAFMSAREAAALGVIGLASGLGVALLKAREAALARDAAAAARDEAQRRLGEIKRITTDLVFRHGDAVNLLPGGAATQEMLLRETVASLEPALAAAPDDAELQAMMASALARLAEIQGNTVTAAPERADEARATVARALALGERAWAERCADWRFAQWHARARTVQAQTLRDRRRLDEAVAVLRRATAEAEQSLALQTAPLGRAYMSSALANLYLLLGQVHDHLNLPSLNQPEAALAALTRAEAHYRAMLDQPAQLQALDATGTGAGPSSDCYFRHQVGTVLGARALIRMRQQRFAEARTLAEQALALRRRNVELEPLFVAWRDGLMVEANTVAQLCVRQGDGAAALAAATLARETALALARDEGPTSKWGGVMPMLAPGWAGALLAVGRAADAREAIAAALAILQPRLLAQPGDEALQQRVSALQALQVQADAPPTAGT